MWDAQTRRTGPGKVRAVHPGDTWHAQPIGASPAWYHSPSHTRPQTHRRMTPSMSKATATDRADVDAKRTPCASRRAIIAHERVPHSGSGHAKSPRAIRKASLRLRLRLTELPHDRTTPDSRLPTPLCSFYREVIPSVVKRVSRAEAPVLLMFPICCGTNSPTKLHPVKHLKRSHILRILLIILCLRYFPL